MPHPLIWPVLNDNQWDILAYIMCASFYFQVVWNLCLKMGAIYMVDTQDRALLSVWPWVTCREFEFQFSYLLNRNNDDPCLRVLWSSLEGTETCKASCEVTMQGCTNLTWYYHSPEKLYRQPGKTQCLAHLSFLDRNIHNIFFIDNSIHDLSYFKSIKQLSWVKWTKFNVPGTAQENFNDLAFPFIPRH